LITIHTVHPTDFPGGKLIIHLTLYGLLREILPREARGKTDLKVAEGTLLENIVADLDIKGPVVFSVNGEVERDLQRVVNAEDRINIFRPAGGG
jgi:sulfur carrier protein ThiS